MKTRLKTQDSRHQTRRGTRRAPRVITPINGKDTPVAWFAVSQSPLPQMDITPTRLVMLMVEQELKEARAKQPGAFPSLHHAHSVLLEELREVEVEIFKRKPNAEHLQRELLQFAAMCVRALEDVVIPMQTTNRQAKR